MNEELNEGCGYSWDHTVRDLGKGSWECTECGAEGYDEPVLSSAGVTCAREGLTPLSDGTLLVDCEAHGAIGRIPAGADEAGRADAMLREHAQQVTAYEELQAEVVALRAQVARVRALAVDPRWELPPDGTILHVSYTGGYAYGGATRPDRERIYQRSDLPGDGPEGTWYAFGDDAVFSYGEVLAHDDPPEDRPTVSVEPLVYAYEIVHALDGPVTGGRADGTA